MYNVKFLKNIIKWGKYGVCIYKVEKLSNGGVMPEIHREYIHRKDIANLIGINVTKLTNVLVSKYNAEIIGGKKYHSYFCFEEKDTEEVREFFESLIIMKQLEGIE